IYLGIALFIGAITNNRWQALIGSIAIWFITIVIWPLLLIRGLSLLPYSWIYAILEVSTFLNPAELVRICSMMKMGAGSAFGPEDAQGIGWAAGPDGVRVFMVTVVIWIVLPVLGGAFSWERRDDNG